MTNFHRFHRIVARFYEMRPEDLAKYPDSELVPGYEPGVIAIHAAATLQPKENMQQKVRRYGKNFQGRAGYMSGVLLLGSLVSCAGLLAGVAVGADPLPDRRGAAAEPTAVFPDDPEYSGVIAAVMQQREVLRGTATCGAELRAQALWLNAQSQAHHNTSRLNFMDVNRAAQIADAAKVPCSPPGNGIALTYTAEYNNHTVTVDNMTLTDFDVPNVCPQLRQGGAADSDMSGALRNTKVGLLADFARENNIPC